MSPTPALERAVAPPKLDQFDLRSHARYPIALKVRYKLMGTTGVKRAGSGRTLDISSRGLLFETTDAADDAAPFHENGKIEMDIDWPFLLDEVCALKIVVRGHIVRSDNRRLAVRIDQYEFRTAGAVFHTPRTQSGVTEG